MAIAILQNAGAGMPTYEIKEKVEKNGEIVITPDTGYGFSKVTLDVSVPVEDHGVIDGSLTSCGVPAEAKCVKPYCFYNCSDLESVTFDDNSQCKIIGSHAFDGCINLKTVKIPKKCGEIGEGAFNGCSSMTTYDLTSCEVVPKIEDDSICTDGDPQILVPAGLYNDFCEDREWSRYIELFKYNVIDNVDISKFSLFLTYDQISQAFEGNVDISKVEKCDDQGYLRVFSKEGSHEIFAGVDFGALWEYTGPTAGQYLVLKYRSKLADEDRDRITDYMEIWATTSGEKFSDGNGNMFPVRAQRDGRWHTIVLNIENSLIALHGENNCKYVPNQKLRALRVDVFNPVWTNTSINAFATDKSYFDIAYIGMCDSIDKVKEADPDYTGAGFDYNDLISLLPGASIGYTDFGMPYANIECTIEHNNYTDPEQIKFIYNDDSVLPNVGRYAAILYTGLQGGGGNGLVQVWLSSKKIRENEENVVAENPNAQIEYNQCIGNEWRYGVAELSGNEYTNDVCRCIRFDYIDGYYSWDPDVYELNLKIAFLKFFDSADDATEYCKAYMRKYGLLEET